jgi:hypothetical protein
LFSPPNAGLPLLVPVYIIIATTQIDLFSILRSLAIFTYRYSNYASIGFAVTQKFILPQNMFV